MPSPPAPEPLPAPDKRPNQYLRQQLKRHTVLWLVGSLGLVTQLRMRECQLPFAHTVKNAQSSISMEFDNWKDMLLAYPFLPTRFLKHRFGDFEEYDLSNWIRKPSVKAALDRDNWKVAAEGMKPDDAKRILTAYWKFYLLEELKLDFDNDPEIVSKVVGLTANRSHPLHTVLYSGRYFRQVGTEFERWLQRGYTIFSYVCFHMFPGRQWCVDKGINPLMFFQCSVDLELDELLSLMENIWLRQIKKLPPHAPTEQIDVAKRIFFARHMDKDLLDRRQWRAFGLSTTYTEGGIKRYEELLAKRFSVALGLIADDDKAWSSAKFRKLFPQSDLRTYRYTGTFPADLHHLLDRAQFPEFIYHKENVVPLNPQVHALITRKNGSQRAKRSIYRHKRIG